MNLCSFILLGLIALVSAQSATLTNEQPYALPPPAAGVQFSQVSPSGDVYLLTYPVSAVLENNPNRIYFQPPLLTRYNVADDFTFSNSLPFPNTPFSPFTQMQIDGQGNYIYLISSGSLIQVSISGDEMSNATFTSGKYSSISAFAQDVQGNRMFVAAQNASQAPVIFSLTLPDLTQDDPWEFYPSAPVTGLHYSNSQSMLVFLTVSNSQGAKAAQLGTLDAATNPPTLRSNFTLPNFGPSPLNQYLYTLELTWGNFSLISFTANGWMSLLCDFVQQHCEQAAWGNLIGLNTPNGPLVFENGNVFWPDSPTAPFGHWTQTSITNDNALVAPFVITVPGQPVLTVGMAQNFHGSQSDSRGFGDDVIAFDLDLVDGLISSNSSIGNLRQLYTFAHGVAGELVLATNAAGNQLYVASEFGHTYYLVDVSTTPTIIFSTILPGIPIGIAAVGNTGVAIVCHNTSIVGNELNFVLVVFKSGTDSPPSYSLPLDPDFYPQSLAGSGQNDVVIAGGLGPQPTICVFDMNNGSIRMESYNTTDVETFQSVTVDSAGVNAYLGTQSTGGIWQVSLSDLSVKQQTSMQNKTSDAVQVRQVILNQNETSLYALSDSKLQRFTTSTLAPASPAVEAVGWSICYDSSHDAIAYVSIINSTNYMSLVPGSALTSLLAQTPFKNLPFETNVYISACVFTSRYIITNTLTNYIAVIHDSFSTAPPTTTSQSISTTSSSSTSPSSTSPSATLTGTSATSVSTSRSTSTSSTTSERTPSNPKHHSNTGAVVGGVLGGLFGTLALVGGVAAFFYLRKRRGGYAQIING